VSCVIYEILAIFSAAESEVWQSRSILSGLD